MSTARKNRWDYGTTLVTHGLSGTPEHRIWKAMRTRCTNPNCWNYKYYGGRGVKMCEEWVQSFKSFFDHVGPRPSPKHSIDRIDNNRDYEPGNVRWAGVVEQRRNSRHARQLLLNGESHCISEWAEIIGIPASLISSRLYNGWSVVAALTTPKVEHGKNIASQ